jgi:hypothetical protein
MKKVFDLNKTYEINGVSYKVTMSVETDYKGEMSKPKTRLSERGHVKTEVGVVFLGQTIAGMVEEVSPMEKSLTFNIKQVDAPVFDEQEEENTATA